MVRFSGGKTAAESRRTNVNGQEAIVQRGLNR